VHVGPGAVDLGVDEDLAVAAAAAADPTTAPPGYVVGEDGQIYKDPTAGMNFPKYGGLRRKRT